MRKPMNIDFERCNSGIEFEEWVKELLGQLRMKAERVVKNDCGIDIIAIAAVNKNTTKRFYIQCKYYNRFLGKGPIQEIFAGTAHHKEYGEPVVITNNYVTFETRRYAKDLAVEIIAAPEWEEFKRINIEGRVDNPNQHTGLFGLMIAKQEKVRHVQIPSGEHSNGPFNLGAVNGIHSQIEKMLPESAERLPATKYLNQYMALFIWLWQHKGLPLADKELLLKRTIANSYNYAESYDKIKVRPIV